MTVNAQGRTKRPLRVVLATATLVGLYLLGTLGVSGVAMTVGSGPAHAKKKSVAAVVAEAAAVADGAADAVAAEAGGVAAAAPWCCKSWMCARTIASFGYTGGLACGALGFSGRVSTRQG